MWDIRNLKGEMLDAVEGKMAIGRIIIWLKLHITQILIDIRKSLFALKTGLINAPVQVGVDCPK